MLRSRINSRSYHLLKTCQTCTTSCLPETVSTCSSHHDLTAALQNRVLWPANPHFFSKKNARVTQRRGQQELALFSGKLQPSGVTSGIPLSHSQSRAMGTSWSVQGLMGFISEAFGPELCQVIIYWSLMHSHLIGCSLQKVHFHSTLLPFSSTVCSGWWAASTAQLGRSAGVRCPIPTAVEM